jgi:RNA-binding protein Musashi
MMDKDTGRPRGFGFVTFDGDEAVDRALSRPLEIKGKPIEVKRAQPRSTLQAQAQEDKKFGRQQGTGFNRAGDGGFNQQQPGMPTNPAMGGEGGITPAVMAKYWYNMQQYFKMMQQQMGTSGGPPQMGMPNPMAAGMNPMMAGMMGMPGGAGPTGSPIPGPQAAAMMGQGMPPQQPQQQQQQQQQQNTPPQQQQMMSPQNHSDYDDQQQMSGANQDFNQAQNSFDREKHERREAQRMQQQQYQAQQSGYGQASWESMYDDIPQPNMGPGSGQRGGYGRGGYGRGGRQQNTPPVPSNAPLNAPTGPKNAGRPGANYRGGGRGSRGGFHPYSR